MRSAALAKIDCVFQGMNSGVPKGRRRSSGDAARGAQMAFRHTVGRVNPWQVARQQSLPLFHPAKAMYRNATRRARATAHNGKSRGQDDRTRCSEGSLVFCLDNGVHYNLNLIERVWKFVKSQCLRSHYYASYDEFTAAIQQCLDDLPTKHKAAMDSLLTHNFQTFENVSLLAA
jgi:hypothetical protein